MAATCGPGPHLQTTSPCWAVIYDEMAGGFEICRDVTLAAVGDDLPSLKVEVQGFGRGVVNCFANLLSVARDSENGTIPIKLGLPYVQRSMGFGDTLSIFEEKPQKVDYKDSVSAAMQMKLGGATNSAYRDRPDATTVPENFTWRPMTREEIQGAVDLMVAGPTGGSGATWRELPSDGLALAKESKTDAASMPKQAQGFGEHYEPECTHGSHSAQDYAETFLKRSDAAVDKMNKAAKEEEGYGGPKRRRRRGKKGDDKDKGKEDENPADSPAKPEEKKAADQAQEAQGQVVPSLLSQWAVGLVKDPGLIKAKLSRSPPRASKDDRDIQELSDLMESDLGDINDTLQKCYIGWMTCPGGASAKWIIGQGHFRIDHNRLQSAQARLRQGEEKEQKASDSASEAAIRNKTKEVEAQLETRDQTSWQGVPKMVEQGRATAASKEKEEGGDKGKEEGKGK